MASKKKDIRPVITLACNDCKERNYTTEKNRRNDPNRMEFNKYCLAAASTRCIAKPSNTVGAEQVPPLPM